MPEPRPTAKELLASTPAREQPQWSEPMLATLTDERFSDPAWIFERKLDGVRCLAFRQDGEVRLLSRTRHAANAIYPELVEALADANGPDLVADGEVVAFEGSQTSFARLQRRLGIQDPDRARATGVAVYYYLFDLLQLDGHDVSGLAVRERKTLLRDALAFADPLRFLPHRNGAGEEYYREACGKGWEGLIAKRVAAPYRGGRSRDWLKLKCVNEQEFVIGGYTDPGGARIGFGALLVGYYEGDELRYAGKVGTGYSEAVLRELSGRLRQIERDDPPFAAGKLPRAHWVEPRLVGQVGFTELTADGRLRHPRFLGLRDDKPPRQVVLERAS